MRGEVHWRWGSYEKVSEGVSKELVDNASILFSPEFAWSALPLDAERHEGDDWRTIA